MGRTTAPSLTQRPQLACWGTISTLVACPAPSLPFPPPSTSSLAYFRPSAVTKVQRLVRQARRRRRRRRSRRVKCCHKARCVLAGGCRHVKEEKLPRVAFRGFSVEIKMKDGRRVAFQKEPTSAGCWNYNLWHFLPRFGAAITLHLQKNKQKTVFSV